jgi:hypothetical protein
MKDYKDGYRNVENTLSAPCVESSSLVTDINFLAILSASLLTSPNLTQDTYYIVINTSGKTTGSYYLPVLLTTSSGIHRPH